MSYNKPSHLLRLQIVILIAAALTSCGQLDITKRRYRKGYHIAFSKAHKIHKVSAGNTQDAQLSNELEPKEPVPFLASNQEVPEVRLDPIATQEIVKPRRQNANRRNFNFSGLQFRQWKRELLEPETEEYNKLAIASAASGLGAWIFSAFMIWGVFLLSAATSIAAAPPLWWVFGILALLASIAAFVLGIMATKTIKKNGGKGNGFAITGITMGVIGMVASMLGLILGFLIYLVTGRE